MPDRTDPSGTDVSSTSAYITATDKHQPYVYINSGFYGNPGKETVSVTARAEEVGTDANQSRYFLKDLQIYEEFKKGDLVEIPTQKTTGDSYETFIQELQEDQYSLDFLMVTDLNGLPEGKVGLAYYEYSDRALLSNVFNQRDLTRYSGSMYTPENLQLVLDRILNL